MRGGLSPIEARRLVGQQDRIEQPCPSRRAERISRSILMFVVFALVLTMCGAWAARAADRYPKGAYAVWLFHAAQPNEVADIVRIYKISGDYPDRETCLQVLSSVVTKAKGAVARCLPVEPRTY